MPYTFPRSEPLPEQLNVRVDEDRKRRVYEAARAQDITVGQFVRRVIDKALHEQPPTRAA